MPVEEAVGATGDDIVGARGAIGLQRAAHGGGDVARVDVDKPGVGFARGVRIGAGIGAVAGDDAGAQVDGAGAVGLGVGGGEDFADFFEMQ